MTKVVLFRFLVVIASLNLSVASAQKVKYKDVFGLLSTKQYEQAEPFLKKYLLTNDDNPNAYLFMGVIFQEKAAKMDVLKQTSLVIANTDSSIIFFDKARKTIDDREVRKNKEYYQSYSRRDLRTGEFGVQLSDIQFDLEKKIQSQKERIDKVKMVKYYFSLSDSLYKKCNNLYISLTKTYPSERQMYLRADESTLKSLSSLMVKFDSCTKAFENYKTSTSNLGRTGYNQNVALMDINDFLKDGISKADFYKDDLKLWDYRKFAEKGKQIIEKEIIPMRNHLITYDIEINKLRDKLNTDSVSVRSDLTKLIDVLLYDQLKKYDPQPLPMHVFSMKTADLEYRSIVLENKKQYDSADIHYRLSLLDTEFRYLNKLDSTAGKLASENIDDKALDYSYFITNTYSNTLVLQSYIKALKEYAQREKRIKTERYSKVKEALNWMVEGADSIPLNPGYNGRRFKTLFTSAEKFTVGLAFNDSANADGYLYAITPSRIPKLKFNFPVDKASFRSSSLPKTKALTYADPSGQVYYVLIYGESPVKEKYPATLAKIYTSDGLAWSNNIPLSFIPKEITFRQETSELAIKNDSGVMLIDKNGKVLK